ncbi:aminotransferase class I/II-fold pyridoxal phosphate-dependent enzyme [Antrihabitans sp. NCIMB 15449]|uniref:Aminotransferase class I/II-fold pyridoxal phosphate-dependent enzyme n=1 Tax=Antrihabitans spumae TaxID=3373370 RepID=A0ABW7JV75_9NOCA
MDPTCPYALEHEQGWVRGLRDELQVKRDRLSKALTDNGFDVKRSEGGYFVCADVTPLGIADALAFCRELPDRIGLAAVPVSAFADDFDKWNRLVRFTFCKKDETLDAGIERLARLR